MPLPPTHKKFLCRSCGGGSTHLRFALLLAVGELMQMSIQNIANPLFWIPKLRLEVSRFERLGTLCKCGSGFTTPHIVSVPRAYHVTIALLFPSASGWKLVSNKLHTHPSPNSPLALVTCDKHGMAHHACMILVSCTVTVSQDGPCMVAKTANQSQEFLQGILETFNDTSDAPAESSKSVGQGTPA